MLVQMWLGTGKEELRHNTSKRSFDVLWPSNKARMRSTFIRFSPRGLEGDSNNPRMRLERHSRLVRASS